MEDEKKEEESVPSSLIERGLEEYRDFSKFMTSDTSQYMFLALFGTVEGFKVLMASLLTIFVVQDCDGTLCTYDDIVHRGGISMWSVIGNALSVLMFIAFYAVEIRREIFLIHSFDIDQLQGDYHLPAVINEYPAIRDGLKKHNTRYRFCTRLLLAVTGVNWVISIITVFYYWYSVKTVLSLTTNILLVTTKLTGSHSVATESIGHGIAISAFMKEFTSYNVIDKDLIVHKAP